MKVEVYWNLTKKCFSVRHKGKVIRHVPYIALEDVEWVVQPAGNARVRRTNRKNVHAFARGYLLHHVADDIRHRTQRPITYNPYEYTTFVNLDTKQPVLNSEYALFTTTYNATHNYWRPTVTIT